MTKYPIEIQKDIYSRILENMDRYRQWSAVTNPDWISRAVHYLSSATCLLEYLENVTVFHVGGGFNRQYGISLEKRIESFSHLKS